MTEVTIFFSQIDEPVPDDLETARIKISELGQRRHLKVWHDHSDILNRTYFSIMISCIYDRAFYLTNQEYKAKYPDRKPVHVQSLVEKPKMYVFGQSKAQILIRCHIPQHVFKIYKHSIFQLLDP